MKLKVTVVLFVIWSLLWIGANCSLSCARIFFLLEGKVKRLILIDQRSDLALEPLFDTSDWSITILKNTNTISAQETHPGTDIIITTSVATFSRTPIELTTGRAHVILSDERPTIDAVSLVYSKFDKTLRSNVIIIAKVGKAMWHFYRFYGFDCTINSAGSVVAFAECDKNESRNLTYSRMPTKIVATKCPVIIAAMEFQPFTYFDESRRFYKGIDYFLVKNIAQKLRIDVNIVRADANSTKCVFRKCGTN